MSKIAYKFILKLIIYFMPYYETYNYTPSKKTKKNKFLKFMIVLVFIVLVFLYLTYYVNPKIVESSEAQIKSLAITEINKSVKMVTLNPNLYNNLINISYNNNGDINMITSNSQAINALSTSIIETSQNLLTHMGEQGIKIHLGNFSGLALLSNVGPKITIRMTPIGTTQTKLKSNFTSKGINQTLHSLFLNIMCEIKIILPIKSINLKIENEVLIAESVIVGKIPNTYLSADKIFSLY